LAAELDVDFLRATTMQPQGFEGGYGSGHSASSATYDNPESRTSGSRGLANQPQVLNMTFDLSDEETAHIQECWSKRGTP
jgi:hypothetical protein